jgi:hypothetical protein
VHQTQCDSGSAVQFDDSHACASISNFTSVDPSFRRALYESLATSLESSLNWVMARETAWLRTAVKRMSLVQVGSAKSRTGAFLAGTIMAIMATMLFIGWLAYLPTVSSLGSADSTVSKQKVLQLSFFCCLKDSICVLSLRHLSTC